MLTFSLQSKGNFNVRFSIAVSVESVKRVATSSASDEVDVDSLWESYQKELIGRGFYGEK